MADYTARLKLRMPVDADPASLENDVWYNLDKIDENINARSVVNPGARPTPYDGQILLEDDTFNLSVFSSSWKAWANQKFARGFIGRAEMTAIGSVISTTTEAGPFMSFTFTADADRIYWVETHFWVSKEAGPDIGIQLQPRLRWAAGASVTTAGTQIGGNFGATSPNNEIAEPQNFHRIYEWTPAVSAQVTVGLFAFNPSTNNTGRLRANSTNRRGQLLVRDVSSVAP